MRTIKQGIIGVFALLFASAVHSFAIEGLKVSVQSTNVALSWPSTNDETYLVQYQPALNATSSWTMLTNLFPASATNLTVFVHSNVVSGGPGRTGFYQVVRDGAHLVGISNNMTLSGIVRIPVEVGNDAGNLVNLCLTANDSPVGDSIQSAPINFPLALTVDTTRMSNGVHQISASVRWEDTNGGFWEADSPPVSVNVCNEISFPNWMPCFGELYNSLLISAQSAHIDADWYIDVYDSQFSYIGTFGGHTYDGNIAVAWDLIGPYGEPHYTDSFFIFVIETDWTAGAQAQGNSPEPQAEADSEIVATPRTYRVTDPWPGSGAWVAVCQHIVDGAIDHDLLYRELQGFVGAAQGLGWPVYPPPYYDDDLNLYPFAIHFQGGSEYADWATFREALYSPLSRNLVYFGHAGPNNLGYIFSNTNVSISAKEIGSVLHTIPAGQTNRHAFRFVFLDGCSTAKGSLPEAFGILHREGVSLDEYQAAAMRPSAFVGWSADKYIAFLFGLVINYSHVNFIVHIQTEMTLNGVGIKEAVTRAARYPDVHWYFLWTGQMKVYGYGGLTLGQYND